MAGGWLRRAVPPGPLAASAIAACLALASAPSAAQPVLEVTLADEGAVLVRVVLPDPPEWCVLWRHSVAGFEVSDCYAARDGAMVLVRSHMPDFAAGLGHVPGRGRQVDDGQGGYVIEGIDEAVPGNAYILRPGAMAVDHRIRAGETEISLSRLAARQRLRIALIDE